MWWFYCHFVAIYFNLQHTMIEPNATGLFMDAAIPQFLKTNER